MGVNKKATTNKAGYDKAGEPMRIVNRLQGLLVAEDKSSHTSQLRKKLKLKRRKVVIGALVLCIVALAVCMSAVVVQNRDVPTNDVVQELPQISSNHSAGDIVQLFGADYETSLKDLQKLPPAQWDKEMLDRAYFSLLYADKVNVFTQVYTVLAMIDAAESSGLDIDNNSYGIDQSAREEMRNRADNCAQRVLSDDQGGEGG